LSQCDKKILDNCEIFFGDIRDFNRVKLATKNIDSIIHLAALIGIPYSYTSSESYVDTNIKGTLNLLNAAKDRNISKFIHTSTSEVYGSAQYIPMNENHPINSQSPYAATKAAADNLAMSYFKSFKLPVTILRPFNTYGPRQSMRAVIPTIISQTLFNSGKIMLGNTKAKRDYTFVKDTTNAFKLALNNKKCVGETLNIGNNFESSIYEIVKYVEKITGIKTKIISDRNRFRPSNSEVNRLKSCNKKIKKVLKWHPKLSDKKGFEDGLKQTIDWVLANKKNFEKNKIKKYII
jgi:NAD dependent epimerase/dehydratase